MNIVLIGFMGCGKTTLGIRLSYRMKQPFIDTDKYIEKKQNKTIKEIFAEQGEMAFREIETNTLREMVDSKMKNQVISTGGGMPTREENHELLQELGVVVWLRVKPETVIERLKDDTTRPLLQGENPQGKIEELLSIREPLYTACADVIVDVDGKRVEQIMDEIFTKSGGVWKRKKKKR